MSRVRVLIADSRRLFSEVLANALSDFQDFEIMSEHPMHGREVINLVQLHRPDIVILDFWLGEMQGIAVARLIQKESPATAVLLLAWSNNLIDRNQAKAAGLAFISGEVEVEDLAQAIRNLHRERSLYGLNKPSSNSGRGAAPEAPELERWATLTPRELDVLTLLAFRPKDIAATLQISEKTARHHVQSILRKTGARSAVEAVAFARRYGLV